MPTLHVRGVPEALYHRLRALAHVEHRSLSAEVIALLDEALHTRALPDQQAKVLEEIHCRRFMPPAGAPDSTVLLREDRAR